jgi:predicted RNA-binding Zn-ribbon protein involved in translation (DUF1610 family)
VHLLEQFFRRLVDSLIAIDPGRLHRPLELGEIPASILPYRSVRRVLNVDTAEDYDHLLLQLCAGEGGYARTDPLEAQEQFQTELRSANPDLGILRSLAATKLILTTEQLAYALGPDPETAYAPHDVEDAHVFEAEPDIVRWTPAPGATTTRFSLDDATPPPATATERPNRCQFCGGSLPAGRAVNFCPHCGQSQSFTRCPDCGSEVELGWRHCASCGVALEAE